MLTLAGWQGKGAKFPLFSKIDVNGPNTHPLYKKLKTDASNKTLMSMFGEYLRHAAPRECQIVQGSPPSSFQTYGPPHPIKYLICLALPMACKDRLKESMRCNMILTLVCSLGKARTSSGISASSWCPTARASRGLSLPFRCVTLVARAFVSLLFFPHSCSHWVLHVRACNQWFAHAQRLHYHRYEPTTSPNAILPDIESAINRARIMS